MSKATSDLLNHFEAKEVEGSPPGPSWNVAPTHNERAVVQAVGQLEGYVSISDFVEAAARRELRRLQRKYNEGRKWPGVEAGELRPGRRTRAEMAVREDR